MNQSTPLSALRIAEVAQAAREIHRIAQLELASELGRLVLDELYDSDLQRLRARGASDVTLRLLAFHGELPLGPSDLYDTLAIFEVIEAFGGVDACRHIGARHIRAVLGLSLPAQLALLERAERCCWSVRELQNAVDGQSGWRRRRVHGAMTSCTAPSAA